jgi:hypothetical protein
MPHLQKYLKRRGIGSGKRKKRRAAQEGKATRQKMEV